MRWSDRVSRAPTPRRCWRRWCRCAGLDRVGIDDDFFALGGDSIVSIQLVTRCRAARLAVTARQVFELRTVAALAAACEQRRIPGGTRQRRPSRRSPRRASGADADRVGGGALGHRPRPVLAGAAAGGTRRADGRGARSCSRRAAHDAPHAAFTLRRGTACRSGRCPSGGSPTQVVCAGSTSPAAPTRVGRRLRRRTRVHVRGVRRVRTGSWRSVCGGSTSAPGGKTLFRGRQSPGGAAARPWRILVPDLATAVAQAHNGEPVALAGAGTSFRAWTRGLVDAARSERSPRRQPTGSASSTPVNRRSAVRPLDPALDTVSTLRSVKRVLPTESPRAHSRWCRRRNPAHGTGTRGGEGPWR